MTSRERVLKTLRHEEPDRVPVDLGGMASTSIMAIAYNRLKKELGYEKSPTMMIDVSQQLAVIEREIIDHFELDVISLEQSYLQYDKKWKEWTLPDSSKVLISEDNYPEKKNGEWVLMDGDIVRARMPKSCLYFESCNPPLENATTEKEINSFKWKILPDEYFRILEEKAKKLYEETDLAIMGNFGGSVFEEGQYQCGYSTFMLNLMMNPDLVDALLSKITETHLTNLEKYLQAVGKYIQVIQMGDDLGMQSGGQISLDQYQNIIKPRHKRIYQYVKNNSDLFVFLHSCGSIYDFIPDLIDAGVDIINPVQFNAAKMDSKNLKKEFGDKLTFWGGGVDTQKVLSFGDTSEVETQVKEQIEIFAPGGGFIFTAVHNIQANISTKNIISMFNTVKQNRNY